MRVPLHIVEARRAKLAALIERHRYLPIGELCRQLGVSEATTRRDLAALASSNKVTRTHGGALAEFNERFPSFHERRGSQAPGKTRIARKALGFFRPGGTYFLDSGTTIFALAEAFREAPVTPLTIVTSNIPVGELLSTIPDLNVCLTAGQILSRQSVLLGDTARRSLEFWNFDLAILSAEAANADGLWNSQESIVQQQLVAIRRSTHTLFCLNASKIGASAPFFLKGWRDVDFLLTDASPTALSAAGLFPALVNTIPCDLSQPIPNLEILPPPAFPVHFL